MGMQISVDKPARISQTAGEKGWPLAPQVVAITVEDVTYRV